MKSCVLIISGRIGGVCPISLDRDSKGAGLYLTGDNTWSMVGRGLYNKGGGVVVFGVREL